ncbi:MAG: peptide deformylase [Chloroflexota bacterium]
MEVQAIRCYPDPVLRRRAKRVPSTDGSVQKIIDDMIATMHTANGVGLAAPQIGLSLRIAVLQMPEEELIVLINPEMVKRRGEREIEEACLSLPGYRGLLKRSESVTVKAKDRRGKEIRLKATGLLSQALEHELDHLNGILYFDHIEDRENNFYRVETVAEANHQEDGE